MKIVGIIAWCIEGQVGMDRTGMANLLPLLISLALLQMHTLQILQHFVELFPLANADLLDLDHFNSIGPSHFT